MGTVRFQFLCARVVLAGGLMSAWALGSTVVPGAAHRPLNPAFTKVVDDLSIGVTKTSPNPSKPTDDVTISYTIGNATSGALSVKVYLRQDGVGMLWGKPVNIPAKSSVDERWVVAKPKPGSHTIALKVTAVVLTGGIQPVGPNGLQIATRTLEATGQSTFSTIDGCKPKLYNVAWLETLIKLVETVDSLPSNLLPPGAKFNKTFGTANHYSFAAMIHPPEQWERDLLNQGYLALRGGDGNIAVTVAGGGLRFHQEYDLYLPGMRWGLTLDQAIGLVNAGGLFNATTNSVHLKLDVPGEDTAKIIFLVSHGDPLIAAGLAAADLPGKLQRVLQNEAGTLIGDPIDNGIAGALSRFFMDPQDNDGRRRANRFGYQGNNVAVPYCFPGF